MTTDSLSDSERLYLIVLHMARRLRDFDVAAGISATRFSALASLIFHGEMNIGQLAAFERVSRPAMTRLVRDLEKDGFVTRRADPADGRGVIVSTTPAGRRIVGKIRGAKIAFVDDFLTGQSKGLRGAMSQVLAPLEELAEAEESRWES